MSEGRALFGRPDAAEEFRRLAHQVRSMYPGGGTLMVTGVSGGEGVTSVVAGLGRALASEVRGGVGVIDCNFRDPALHEALGAALDGGLIDAFHDASLPIKTVPGVDGLAIVTAGGRAQPGQVVLRQEQLLRIVSLAKESFDLSLFDSAPVAVDPETGRLGPLVDGVLVVIESDGTKLDAIAFVRSTLERSGARIVGAVMNHSGRYGPASWSNVPR